MKFSIAAGTARAAILQRRSRSATRPRAAHSGVLAASSANRCRAPPDCIALSGTCTTRRCLASSPNIPLRRCRGTRPLPRLRRGSCRANTAWFSRLNGQRYTQPLTIEMDPRVKTSIADLQKQFELSKQIYDDLLASAAGGGQGCRCIDQAEVLARKRRAEPRPPRLTLPFRNCSRWRERVDDVADAGHKPTRFRVYTDR